MKHHFKTPISLLLTLLLLAIPFAGAAAPEEETECPHPTLRLLYEYSTYENVSAAHHTEHVYKRYVCTTSWCQATVNMFEYSIIGLSHAFGTTSEHYHSGATHYYKERCFCGRERWLSRPCSGPPCSTYYSP